jgi:hypothetical protein
MTISRYHIRRRDRSGEAISKEPAHPITAVARERAQQTDVQRVARATRSRKRIPRRNALVAAWAEVAVQS